MPLFKAVFDLFLERALDGLTGEDVCDLVLQLVQDGGDLFIRRLAMVVAAFQNEALHADETALGIFVMNIFHGIESARLHDQLLGSHRGGIDAVDRIQLAVQLLVRETLFSADLVLMRFKRSVTSSIAITPFFCTYDTTNEGRGFKGQGRRDERAAPFLLASFF